jgi:hypothetical protein
LVAAELVDGLVKLDPAPEDKRQALEVLLAQPTAAMKDSAWLPPSVPRNW